MNMIYAKEANEDEIINYFSDKEHIFFFHTDETIVKRAMDKFGITETEAKSYNQKYTVSFRTKLNNFINEQEEQMIPKEDMISACAEKFALKHGEIEEYIRRLYWFQRMDEDTQKLFEGICF